MVSPKKLLSTAPAIPLIYNYQDVADGTGIVTLYGFSTKTFGAAASSYALSNNTLYSADKDLLAAGNAMTEWDFDLTPFNTSRLMDGKVIVTGYYGITATVTSVSCAITLKKLGADGTTTVLGTAVTPEEANDTSTEYVNFAIPINVSDVKFNPGDILRAHFAMGVVGAGYCRLAIDPMNRDASASTYATTQLRLEVPFKINL